MSQKNKETIHGPQAEILENVQENKPLTVEHYVSKLKNVYQYLQNASEVLHQIQKTYPNEDLYLTKSLINIAHSDLPAKEKQQLMSNNLRSFLFLMDVDDVINTLNELLHLLEKVFKRESRNINYDKKFRKAFYDKLATILIADGIEVGIREVLEMLDDY